MLELLRQPNRIIAFGQEHLVFHFEVKLDWQHPMLDQLRQRNRITSFGQEFFHFELRSVHICMPCQSKICEICKTCKPSYQLLLRPSIGIIAFGKEQLPFHFEVKLDWQHPIAIIPIEGRSKNL